MPDQPVLSNTLGSYQRAFPLRGADLLAFFEVFHDIWHRFTRSSSIPSILNRSLNYPMIARTYLPHL
jgi:hypothetical protein